MKTLNLFIALFMLAVASISVAYEAVTVWNMPLLANHLIVVFILALLAMFFVPAYKTE